MQVAQSIFRYNCHIKFLNDRLNSKSKKLNRYSRALSDMVLAKELGYRSSRSIGMVLEGKRLPSTAMLLQFSNHLELDESERRYLDLLVQRERLVRRRRSITAVEAEMKRINIVAKEKRVIENAYFTYVSDWYHLAIKQLIGVPSFRNDFQWIRQRLKNKISIAEIGQAMKNLKVLGLVEESSGKLRVATPSMTTGHDLPSAKIRQHHKQMMTRATEALDEEPVENREYFSLTFRIDRKNLPLLKKQIRNFKDSMEAQFESADSEDVFQMNLQLFPHTTQLQIGTEK